jgi:hypothetical protein
VNERVPRTRFVVSALGGRATPGHLPLSTFGDRAILTGGERSLYELAFALTACGHDVELRGSLGHSVFDSLRAATGVAPAADLPSRPPTARDVVIVPEGVQDLADWATVFGSDARVVVMLLAPPGLFGWPFTDSTWRPPRIADVGADGLPTRAAIRTMHDLGATIWTNTPGLVTDAEAVGVPCTDIGVGWPAVPEVVRRKTSDVVFVEESRWAAAARRVADALPGRVVPLPSGTPAQFLEDLGRGRVLLWPSSVEGWARITAEARALGTVPVALASNRYGAGFDEESGLIPVSRVEDLPRAIDALLADPSRLESLAARGREWVTEHVSWSRYCERVAGAVDRLPTEQAGPRTAMGALMQAADEARRADVDAMLEQVRGIASHRSSVATDLALGRRVRSTLNQRVGARALGAARGLRAATRRVRGRVEAPPRVLLVPGPTDAQAAVVQVVRRLRGEVVHTDSAPEPTGPFDLCLGWFDSNHARTPGETRRPARANAAVLQALGTVDARLFWNCSPMIDVGKRRLGAAFERAFGRALAVDPVQHRGFAFEKSDENATHDGRVVECPCDPVQGMVYQRLVVPAEPVGDQHQWRIVIMGGLATLAIEWILAPELRFTNQTRTRRPHAVRAVCSDAEIEAIERLALELHLEYAELDLLRDEQGGAWIVDANPTPHLNESAFTGDDYERTLDAYAAAFARWVARSLI